MKKLILSHFALLLCNLSVFVSFFLIGLKLFETLQRELELPLRRNLEQLYAFRSRMRLSLLYLCVWYALSESLCDQLGPSHSFALHRVFR